VGGLLIVTEISRHDKKYLFSDFHVAKHLQVCILSTSS